MTVTTSAPERPQGRPVAGGDPVPGGHIAPTPRARRRPAMVAASVALIAVGALGSAWAWQTSSNTNEVLTVRQTVHRGEVLGADDLLRVRIGVDPAIQAVPAAALESLVGQRAALDIAAGSVITPEQLTDDGIPAQGQSVVGVSLTAGMMPSGQVIVGDKVRVITTETSGSTAGAPAAGVKQPVSGVVVSVTTDATTGNTLMNVQVPSAMAPAVATAAARGQVALVLDSQAG
jgi:hypothetical protein